MQQEISDKEIAGPQKKSLTEMRDFCFLKMRATFFLLQLLHILLALSDCFFSGSCLRAWRKSTHTVARDSAHVSHTQVCCLSKHSAVCLLSCLVPLLFSSYTTLYLYLVCVFS